MQVTNHIPSTDKANLSLVWIATFLSYLLFFIHKAIHLFPYFSLFFPCAAWTVMSLVTYKQAALSTLFLSFSYFHGAILALVTFRASAPVTVAVGLITFGIALTGCFSRVSRYGALAYSGSCLVVGVIAFMILRLSEIPEFYPVTQGSTLLLSEILAARRW